MFQNEGKGVETCQWHTKILLDVYFDSKFSLFKFFYNTRRLKNNAKAWSSRCHSIWGGMSTSTKYHVDTVAQLMEIPGAGK